MRLLPFSKTSRRIKDLISLSHWAGRGLALVQGAGGNGSAKSSDRSRLWVKASGFRLADVTRAHGLIEADLPALEAALRDPHLRGLTARHAHEKFVAAMGAACAGTLRPSMETGLHVSLGPLVLHTHPIYANAFSCMDEGRAAFSSVFWTPFSWIPYAAPGYALARLIAPAHTLILQNHGMAAAGENAAEVRERTMAVLKAGRTFFGALPAGAFDRDHPAAALTSWAAGLSDALEKKFGVPVAARPARFALLNREARHPGAARLWKPLIPDDVVFWSSVLRLADGRLSPAQWLDRKVHAPPAALVVAVDGMGLVVAGSPLQMQSAEENLLANRLIHRLIARHGRARSLTSRQAAVVTSMSSEKYRQTLAYRAR